METHDNQPELQSLNMMEVAVHETLCMRIYNLWNLFISLQSNQFAWTHQNLGFLLEDSSSSDSGCLCFLFLDVLELASSPGV